MKKTKTVTKTKISTPVKVVLITLAVGGFMAAAGVIGIRKNVGLIGPPVSDGGAITKTTKPIITSVDPKAGTSKPAYCMSIVKITGKNFNDANTVYLDGKTDETLTNLPAAKNGTEISFRFISPLCSFSYGNHYFDLKIKNSKGESETFASAIEVSGPDHGGIPTVFKITPDKSTCPATVKLNGYNFSPENMVKIGTGLNNIIGPFSYSGSGDLTIIIPKEACNKIKGAAESLQVLNYDGWSAISSRSYFWPIK